MLKAVTGMLMAKTPVFCDVTEDSVVRGRKWMLYNNVTEHSLAEEQY